MRSQLPGCIATELLDVFDSRAEKQIYRIINELETGTDDILNEEVLSRVSWLPETRRPAPTPPVTSMQSSNLADNEPDLPTYPIQENYRQPYRALPAEIQHEIDAPEYWKVIEHVHKQASKIGSKLHRRNGEAGNLDDLAADFGLLGLGHTALNPDDCPNLFGGDVWLSKFRLGAAGELFVSQLLSSPCIPGSLTRVYRYMKSSHTCWAMNSDYQIGKATLDTLYKHMNPIDT